MRRTEFEDPLKPETPIPPYKVQAYTWNCDNIRGQSAVDSITASSSRKLEHSSQTTEDQHLLKIAQGNTGNFEIKVIPNGLTIQGHADDIKEARDALDKMGYLEDGERLRITSTLDIPNITPDKIIIEALSEAKKSASSVIKNKH
jgi:hypothetical protein